jgi:hypothetical protein
VRTPVGTLRRRAKRQYEHEQKSGQHSLHPRIVGT